MSLEAKADTQSLNSLNSMKYNLTIGPNLTQEHTDRQQYLFNLIQCAPPPPPPLLSPYHQFIITSPCYCHWATAPMKLAPGMVFAANRLINMMPIGYISFQKQKVELGITQWSQTYTFCHSGIPPAYLVT